MPKISKQFTKCRNGNRVIITWDSHLKTALSPVYTSNFYVATVYGNFYIQIVVFKLHQTMLDGQNLGTLGTGFYRCC